jgi:hypothetical protein
MKPGIVLRSVYIAHRFSCARRGAMLLPIAAVLAGCTMSVAGSEDPPATTGSVTQLVHVREPLPQTLAYSDAAKIGEAASAALWQAAASGPADWVNSATGSSGTLEQHAAAVPEGECRSFDTIVTSVAGVHQYSGQVCRGGGGRAVVEIQEPAVEKSI